MVDSKLSTTNGIKIFLALGAYFFIMQAFGLDDGALFRVVNLFIIYYFVRNTVERMIQSDTASLLGVFFSGIITSAIGVITSVIGFTVYISFITGTAYLQELGSTFIPVADSGSLVQYAFALLVEGLCSCLFVSMYLMQKWKNSIGVSPVNAQ